MLLFFRCLVFIGVCVEFVAAVAWLAELFTDPKHREKALGYTQAFSSLGGLLVATANGLCVSLAPSLPALGAILGGTIAEPHAPWRYTVMSGVIPAIPLIIIRPFLPESPAWERKRAAGTLKRPSIVALFAPGAAAHHDRDDADVRDVVRRRVRRDPADPADRAGPARGQGADRGTAGAGSGPHRADHGVGRHESPGDRRPRRPHDARRPGRRTS